MLITFKIDSIDCKSRIQKSIPMYFTSKGLKSGKEQVNKVWDYQIIGSGGKKFSIWNQRKKVGLRTGQTVYATVSKGGSMMGPKDEDTYGIIQRFTKIRFGNKVRDMINVHQNRITNEQTEIARLKLLL